MVRGILGMVLITFVFVSLFIGHELYRTDAAQNVTRDIYNYTDGIKVTASCEQVYNNSIIDLPHTKIERVNRVLCAFSDFLIIASTETMKFGIEFGYENPQYNYDWYFQFIKWYLAAMIIYCVIPIIIPTVVLFYLIGVGAKKAWKYIQDRMDRRKNASPTTEDKQEKK